jgi:hypothetical protein
VGLAARSHGAGHISLTPHVITFTNSDSSVHLDRLFRAYPDWITSADDRFVHLKNGGAWQCHGASLRQIASGGETAFPLACTCLRRTPKGVNVFTQSWDGASRL